MHSRAIYTMRISIHIYFKLFIYTSIFICVYIQRERERKRSVTGTCGCIVSGGIHRNASYRLPYTERGRELLACMVIIYVEVAGGRCLCLSAFLFSQKRRGAVHTPENRQEEHHSRRAVSFSGNFYFHLCFLQLIGATVRIADLVEKAAEGTAVGTDVCLGVCLYLCLHVSTCVAV